MDDPTNEERTAADIAYVEALLTSEPPPEPVDRPNYALRESAWRQYGDPGHTQAHETLEHHYAAARPLHRIAATNFGLSILSSAGTGLIWFSTAWGNEGDGSTMFFWLPRTHFFIALTLIALGLRNRYLASAIDEREGFTGGAPRGIALSFSTLLLTCYFW